MKLRATCTAVITVCLASVAGAAPLADWPEFRGPTAQGHAENATPPLNWSPDQNIAWTATIPGLGWSSPVLHDGALYLTTALVNGDDQPTSLRALRVNADSGAIDWDVEVFPWTGDSKRQPKNSFASPTPIAHNGKIFVHFGPMGTACLDTNGAILWRQTDTVYDTPHGNGGSPLLHNGTLIYACDDAQAPFVVALDAETGKVAWKTQRTTDAAMKFSFSTPLAINVGGQGLVIIPGSGYVGAFDAGDGEEVWRVDYGEGFSVVPRPVYAGGLIFVATGFAKPCSVLAIRPDGTGDVTKSHLAWKTDEAAPHTPSMLAIGEELYFVSDRGEMSCVELKTGKLHWRQDLGGRYSASPVFAGGRIYVTSEEGVTHVIEPGTAFKKLAENTIAEKSYASLAVSGPALFLRTEKRLYRIQAP